MATPQKKVQESSGWLNPQWVEYVRGIGLTGSPPPVYIEAEKVAEKKKKGGEIPRK